MRMNYRVEESWLYWIWEFMLFWKETHEIAKQNSTHTTLHEH